MSTLLQLTQSAAELHDRIRAEIELADGLHRQVEDTFAHLYSVLDEQREFLLQSITDRKNALRVALGDLPPAAPSTPDASE